MKDLIHKKQVTIVSREVLSEDRRIFSRSKSCLPLKCRARGRTLTWCLMTLKSRCPLVPSMTTTWTSKRKMLASSDRTTNKKWVNQTKWWFNPILSWEEQTSQWWMKSPKRICTPMKIQWVHSDQWLLERMLTVPFSFHRVKMTMGSLIEI